MVFIILDREILKDTEIYCNSLLPEVQFRLSQKVWFGFGNIPLFYDNVKLISLQTDILKLPAPSIFKNPRELLRISKRMLNKNKYYKSGYLNYEIIWKNNDSHLLVTPVPFDISDFPFPEEGLLISFSEQRKYSGNNFNKFAFYNKTLWDVALSDIRNTHYQNAVILNEKEMICECAFANVFMIKEETLHTPSPGSGCYTDLLRAVILEAASDSGLNIIEEENLGRKDLLKMDEIFTGSEQSGLNWILGVENKRFIHRHSISIAKRVNEKLKIMSGKKSHEL